MIIAVLGTGRMGGALGPRLAGLGHDVVYGSRDPSSEKVQELVANTGNNASAASPAEAVANADMVALAMPYGGMKETLSQLGDLAGKIILDITNALMPDGEGNMKMAIEGSAAEEVQAALPNAKVVKVFNTVGYHVVANPAAGGAVTTPIAGDDADAKAQVIELAEALGLETADVGPLKHSRSLEAMTVLYMVPYLQGKMDEVFEFHFRKANRSDAASKVRAAG